MLRLLLARHGQPEAHVRGLIQGSADLPLTPTGHLQGRLLAERIQREHRLAAVFSSPLVRACDIAKGIASRLSVPLIVDPRLAEVATGILAGVSRAEAATRWPLPSRGHLLFERIPGGESLIDTYARVAEFLLNLFDVLGEPFPGVLGRRTLRFEGEVETTRDLAPWENELKAAVKRTASSGASVTLLLISHGGALAELFHVLLGLPVNAPAVITHADTGLSEVVLDGGRLWVVRTSCQAHLPPILRRPENRDVATEDAASVDAAVRAWQVR